MPRVYQDTYYQTNPGLHEYVDYGFEDKTTEDFINCLETARHGLLKEIIEGFGIPMDTILKDHEEIKWKESLDGNKHSLHTVSDYSLSANSDGLINGILKFAMMNNLGTNPIGDVSGWSKAVISMAAWYQQNVHTYAQVETIWCPLVSRMVRKDCSGFVTACLWLYGALRDTVWPPASRAYTNDTNIGKKLEEAGFSKIRFSWEEVKPYDIIAFDGHIEIYAGENNGKHQSWAWGSCHDTAHGGLPCITAHQKGGYNIIWRKTGTMNGTINDVIGYSGNGKLTMDIILKVCPKAKRDNVSAVLYAFDNYGSTVGLTEKGKVYMMAQIMHESARFATMEEYASGSQYEGRRDLGNIQPGDGKRFKGRGPLQVTGRANYVNAQKIMTNKFGLDVDIVSHPEIGSQNPKIAALMSMAWMMIPNNGPKAVQAANNGDVRLCTRYINGGQRGLSDRIALTNALIKALS